MPFLTDEQCAYLESHLRAAPSSSRRLVLLTEVLSAYSVSCRQLAAILAVLKLPQEKITAARLAAPHMSDPSFATPLLMPALASDHPGTVREVLLCVLRGARAGAEGLVV